jgi:hypothetical protein
MFMTSYLRGLKNSDFSQKRAKSPEIGQNRGFEAFCPVEEASQKDGGRDIGTGNFSDWPLVVNDRYAMMRDLFMTVYRPRGQGVTS